MKKISSAFKIVAIAFFMFGCVPYLQPIHEAIQRKDMTELKRLIEQGVDINTVDGRGRTPLYWASLMGYTDVAKYLLAKGANIQKGASWKDNEQPLHVAATHGYFELVDLLLKNGADPNAETWSHQTPLQMAAMNGKKDVVNLLLKNKANVNAKDKFNDTALSLAQERNQNEIVQILKDHGAK